MLIPSQIWGEDIHIDRTKVKANLEEIQKSIAHSKIKIIAVTKYFGLDSIRKAVEKFKTESARLVWDKH